MESWYKVALSEQDIRDRKGISLGDEFAALFVASGGPKDAAMFDKVDDAAWANWFEPSSTTSAAAIAVRNPSSGLPQRARLLARLGIVTKR